MAGRSKGFLDKLMDSLGESALPPRAPTPVIDEDIRHKAWKKQQDEASARQQQRAPPCSSGPALGRGAQVRLRQQAPNKIRSWGAGHWLHPHHHVRAEDKHDSHQYCREQISRWKFAGPGG